MDLIQELDYVEVLKKDTIQKEEKKSWNFFDMAGIGKDREVSLGEFREKAWRKVK